MENQLNQKFLEEINKLPSNVRDVINSFNWLEILGKIGEKYSFTEIDIDNLKMETFLLIIGFEKIENYSTNIENNVGLSKEDADQITKKVFDEIFIPIAEKIEQNMSDNQKDIKNINKNEIPTPSKKDIALDPKFSSLSQDLQYAIAESDYQNKIYQVSDKYKLPIDQIGVLEQIVASSLSGSIRPSDFENQIKTKIKLPEVELVELIEYINNEIFIKVRENLKKQQLNSSNKTENGGEDVVPIPPYKNTINNDELRITNEYSKSTENNFNTSGERNNSKAEQEINEVLNTNHKTNKEGEELWKDSGIDILGEKLNKPTYNESTISDHSLPKIGKTITNDELGITGNQKIVDPYRENL